MKNNKIAKNDKVTLNQTLQLPYRKEPLPAGTEMIVWKATRDGQLHCSSKDVVCGFVVTADQVTKVDRNCPMPKIGDLFYSSWGYEQTNIDFYQVTAVTKRMVGLTSIAGKSEYDAPMQGHTSPQPGAFCGDEKLHRINFDGKDQPYFRLNSYSSAWPTKAGEVHSFTEWH